MSPSGALHQDTTHTTLDATGHTCWHIESQGETREEAYCQMAHCCLINRYHITSSSRLPLTVESYCTPSSSLTFPPDFWVMLLNVSLSSHSPTELAPSLEIILIFLQVIHSIKPRYQIESFISTM